MTIASLVIWLLSIIPGIIMSLSPEFEEQMRQAYIDGGMGEDMAAQRQTVGRAMGAALPPESAPARSDSI